MDQTSLVVSERTAPAVPMCQRASRPWSRGLAVAAMSFVAMAASAQPAAAQSGGDGEGAGAILGLLVWLAIGGGVAYFMIRNRAPYSFQAQSSGAPQEVIDSIERAYAMSGWSVASKRGDSITFRAETKGSCLIALLLLLLGIIPGILYLSFRGRTMTTDFMAAAATTGTTIRVNGSTKGFGGESMAQSVIAQLPGGRVIP